MGPCIVNVFQYISNKMQRYTVYSYVETALHVSGGTFTHHQEHIQLYLQHLVFVTPLLLRAAILEELEFFQVTVWKIPDAVDTVVCAPDNGWRYHPKHVEQFPDINKLCNVTSCWICIGICFLDLRDFFPCCRTKQIYCKQVNVVSYLAYIQHRMLTVSFLLYEKKSCPCSVGYCLQL
jgi:hypothetical protein